jgi:hypothetical protein
VNAAVYYIHEANIFDFICLEVQESQLEVAPYPAFITQVVQ